MVGLPPRYPQMTKEIHCGLEGKKSRISSSRAAISEHLRYYDIVTTLSELNTTILIQGRDQPIIFDAVYVMLGCISDIMGG